MLYAINARGRLLLFSGTIHFNDYGFVERVASDIFSKEVHDDPGIYIAKLKDALLSEGIIITPVKIEKVFRPKLG